MKEQKTGKWLKNRLAGILLFQLLAFTFIGFESNAQGWTFTPQIKFTGNCEGGGAAAAQANAMLSALGNLSLPTKGMCESLRSQVLAIQVGGGDCMVGYTCSPCTGSDIGVSGQIPAAGQVNNNSVLQGRSFFSSHESTAFEDWATEYKQLLSSYGITSILGKDIIPNRSLNTPVTGNLQIDTSYAKLAAGFNPSVAPENPYSQDPNVVDLTHLGDKPGVVKLLTDEEEQRKRDEWYQDQLIEQGFNDLEPLTSEGITDDGFTWDRKTQHMVFVGIGVVATVAALAAAGPEIATVGVAAALTEEVGLATVVSWSLPVLETSVNAIQDCYTGNCPTTKEMLVNMGVGQISNVVGTAGTIAGGYAAVATQKAIGTISTKGVNAVKAVWDASFGLTDTGISVWEAIK